MNSFQGSPRSYAYSGGERVPYMFPQRSEMEQAAQNIVSDPREVPAYGFSRASTPVGVGQDNGFFGTINKVASALQPFLDAAVAFKRGYQGFPLPGRNPDSFRMGGDALIFKVYEDMLKRNERESELARQEREKTRAADLQERLILEGVKKGDISWKDALEEINRRKTPYGGSDVLQAPEAPSRPAAPTTQAP